MSQCRKLFCCGQLWCSINSVKELSVNSSFGTSFSYDWFSEKETMFIRNCIWQPFKNAIREGHISVYRNFHYICEIAIMPGSLLLEKLSFLPHLPNCRQIGHFFSCQIRRCLHFWTTEPRTTIWPFFMMELRDRYLSFKCTFSYNLFWVSLCPFSQPHSQFYGTKVPRQSINLIALASEVPKTSICDQPSLQVSRF